MKNYKVSISVLFILIVSSFFPMVQIIMLFINGYLLALLGWILDFSHSSWSKLSFVFHLGMALIFYYKYFKAKVDFSKMCNAILIAIFMNGLTIFSFENSFETSKFLLLLLTGAFATGIPLLIIDIVKNKDKFERMEQFEYILDSEEIFKKIKNS
ncbi:MAG: hypothetical protein AB8F94_23480 [Saprospiraceae bacterium]